jgi:hypothetical protein
MRGLRFSIGGLMVIVLATAIGLAALRNASQTWAGAMLLLTCGILALGVVGAMVRKGAERAWWLGFSLYGWGYMALWWCLPEHPTFVLPTADLLEILGPWLGVAPRTEGIYGGLIRVDGSGLGGGGGGAVLDPSYARTGHCLCALLAALLGSLFSTPFLASSSDPQAGAPEAGRRPRSGWLRPAILGLVVLIAADAAVTIRSGSRASLWAGFTFALTCALVGLAILGAILGRGPRRAIGLGAALFGAGYMALIFSRPAGQPPRAYVPTDRILEALRPWFPPVPGSVSEKNARILEALGRPIPLRFPNETQLEDVLKDIQQATSTPTYPGIPIYVDPVGLMEVERTLWWTVQIDLEGVPLKETLRLCLKQLRLGYEVKDGRLRVTSEVECPEPGLQDPFQIVGHCLLALLAAGFGAVAAPMVAEAGRGWEEHGRAATAEARAPTSSPEDQAGLSAGVKSGEND